MLISGGTYSVGLQVLATTRDKAKTELLLAMNIWIVMQVAGKSWLLPHEGLLFT